MISVLKKRIYQYTVLFEPAEEGGFSVTVPTLPGCISEGDTFEEANAMIQDAIEGYLTSLAAHGEPIPKEPEAGFIGRVIVRIPSAQSKIRLKV